MLTKAFVAAQSALYSFKKDERGVTAIEYAIIGVAVSAIVLAVFNSDLKTALTGAITKISGNIDKANS
ncbi:Flp family type IVb pilin [Vibrio sinaloensis]|uniref:Fimbrial protein n=1 Tax=Photobacterium sp. (strain ATCC 43367) TaxID=379097 RepID=A0A0A5I159_PHOS4|nr:Flp family type IVb pilin [Vibrio sinaloensis]KGY09506.1 fimbrial protein [Vibrio sinaloensis]KIE20032.1 fimbrial protein [Vibrio sinaloensis]